MTTKRTETVIIRLTPDEKQIVTFAENQTPFSGVVTRTGVRSEAKTPAEKR